MTEPIRVVELGGGVAPMFAAKLFGDHGADVIKVEPPVGDPVRAWGPFADDTIDVEQGGLFLALNLNKRGVVVDFDTPQGRARLGELLAWADVVIHGFDRRACARLGIDAKALTISHPHLVTLSITPFGHTGPYADYVATDLILSNAGGWANLCPCTQTDPEMPPLKVFGDQCGLMAGIAGATAALSSRLAAEHTGVGEYIDLSIQEYVANVLEIAVPAASYTGEAPTRVHPRSLIPWRNFATKDGMVFLVCVEQDQWERLVEFMGNPEWASMEVFAEQTSRGENQDLVHTFVAEFVADWETEAFYHAAQQHRVCVAPVLELHQIARNEHLRSRDFFVEVAREGSPTLEYLAPAVRIGDEREAIRRPAPRLGEHDSLLENLTPRERMAASPGVPELPLHGIRVLDMTWAWAGPFCSMNLAHLGAEVIRVESEVRPDLYRRFPVVPPELEPGLNRSGMFNQWNQGKSSIAIDLAQADGIALVKRLVAESDVVVQNFATGVMDRLGLGFEALREINPGIVMASVSGYGQSGPYAQYMGYGPAMPPLTGLSAATGFLDGPPEELGLSMPDPTAGVTAAWSIVSALEKRRHSGAGEHLDVTLWESTGVLNVEGWMGYVLTGREPVRMQNRSSRMAPHGVFRCMGDDAWVAIACRDDADWACLLTVLRDDGVDSLPAADMSLSERLERVPDIEALLATWTASQDRWDVAKRLQAQGIPSFPTLSAQEVLLDPHLNERSFIERLEHPEVGAQAHAGIPWRLDRRANGVRSPSPCIGADTTRHLREILAMGDSEIEQLNARGVVSSLVPSKEATPPL